MKTLAERFEKQFTCSGEIVKNICKFFSTNTERTDKNGEKLTKTVSYRLQFINNARFMASKTVMHELWHNHVKSKYG